MGPGGAGPSLGTGGHLQLSIWQTPPQGSSLSDINSCSLGQWAPPGVLQQSRRQNCTKGP